MFLLHSYSFYIFSSWLAEMWQSFAFQWHFYQKVMLDLPPGGWCTRTDVPLTGLPNTSKTCSVPCATGVPPSPSSFFSSSWLFEAAPAACY